MGVTSTYVKLQVMQSIASKCPVSYQRMQAEVSLVLDNERVSYTSCQHFLPTPGRI
jgi:hypothetical protein